MSEGVLTLLYFFGVAELVSATLGSIYFRVLHLECYTLKDKINSAAFIRAGLRGTALNGATFRGDYSEVQHYY